jgi:hypothetical protein
MEPLIVKTPPEDHHATALEYWAANEIEVLHRRIKEALELASNVDGAHHKQWVIDKMVRVLTGDGYDAWVKAYEACDDECKRYHGPEYGKGDCDEGYSWDEGIAP